MSAFGNIPVPADFRYRELFKQKRPEHQKTDPFRIRHPSMDTSKRAKIFAPFDALTGFSDAIRAQEKRCREASDPFPLPSHGYRPQ